MSDPTDLIAYWNRSVENDDRGDIVRAGEELIEALQTQIRDAQAIEDSLMLACESFKTGEANLAVAVNTIRALYVARCEATISGTSDGEEMLLADISEALEAAKTTDALNAVVADELRAAATEILEKMRSNEVEGHQARHYFLLPETTLTMLNGATRFAEWLVAKADTLNTLATPPTLSEQECASAGATALEEAISIATGQLLIPSAETEGYNEAVNDVLAALRAAVRTAKHIGSQPDRKAPVAATPSADDRRAAIRVVLRNHGVLAGARDEWADELIRSLAVAADSTMKEATL